LPEISGNGRYVSFMSLASTFDDRDTNEDGDIYVHDRELGTTELVSIGSDDQVGDFLSFASSISDDGRFIAIASYASNLTDGPDGEGADIFLRDMQSGTTELVSVGSEGQLNTIEPGSLAPSVSNDGSVVAFDSDANNFVAGDNNNSADTFVHYMDTGETIRVSVDSQGNEGKWGGVDPHLTDDGHVLIFSSESRFVARDKSRTPDTYMHDLTTGKTALMSRALNGEQGDDAAFGTGISDDGRYVTFSSSATNFVPGDTNGDYDHFRFDTVSKETIRLSLNSAGRQARGDKGIYISGNLSGDARFYVWESASKNLVRNDENDRYDVFVRGPYEGA
jgi:hypothetical protein